MVEAASVAVEHFDDEALPPGWEEPAERADSEWSLEGLKLVLHKRLSAVASSALTKSRRIIRMRA